MKFVLLFVNSFSNLQTTYFSKSNENKSSETANENDTKTFDPDICPHLIKNDDLSLLSHLVDLG